MKQKVEVRFPNECYFEEIEIDLNDFKPVNEFDDEVFGWFGVDTDNKKLFKVV